MNRRGASAPALFFYGTLMRGFELRARSGIDTAIAFRGLGTVRGALFDLGPYPAAIRAEGGVRGEVYAVRDTRSLLARLDGIEGYIPGDLTASHYARDRVEVRLDEGGTTVAWVYFYVRPLGDARWIPSGDYRRYLTYGGRMGRPDVRRVPGAHLL